MVPVVGFDPVAGLDPPESLEALPAASDVRPSFTILVIDDDAAVRMIVRRQLEDCGPQVLEAADGQSGLDLIDTYPGPIDLVLTDIDMPRIDGITVAEVLAALRPLLGVICMSGGTGERRFADRLGVRAQSFLPKPFTGETLTRVLGAELARSRNVAARLPGGETASRSGATEGEQPFVATAGLVAAAQRLQQGDVQYESSRPVSAWTMARSPSLRLS
jgi:CheY-like chemotaxis protein